MQDECQRRDLSCSSIVFSLVSIVVSRSSISLSILPSSSSRGPMYCPGLSGEGRGSIGLGRNGSGRLGRSNRGLVDPVGSLFSGFSSSNIILLRVGIVAVLGFKTTFQSRKDSFYEPGNRSKQALIANQSIRFEITRSSR